MIHNSENQKPVILIVDDVPKNLQVLGTILYQEGCEIAMADSGATALETLEDITPALILLDIMMPEMDGFEVCERIKSNPQTKDIPIIFLTAKTEVDDIIRGFQAGAVDYLTKPFNTNELLARVRTQITLYKKTQELEQLNNSLEEKVKSRTQELVDANAKLVKLDLAKTYFLGLLSHELNTPLTGIQGFANILKSELKDEEHQEFCQHILESSDRLKKFSELSILITRLQTEKYIFQSEENALEELVDTTIEKLEASISEKNVSIEKSIAKFDHKIFGDKFLFIKLIEMIADNAIKFSPEQSVVKFDGRIGDKYYILSIQDSGSGFDPEQLSNIFDFFVSDELQHHKEGFGLGLSTAKIIMDAHGGKIQAKNNPSGGAIIDLMFSLE